MTAMAFETWLRQGPELLRGTTRVFARDIANEMQVEYGAPNLDAAV